MYQVWRASEKYRICPKSRLEELKGSLEDMVSGNVSTAFLTLLGHLGKTELI